MRSPPFTDDHPDCQVSGWRELLAPKERIPAVEMVRHTLVTGETGSGKNASAVIPLLEGVLRYPDEVGYEAYRKTAGNSAEPREQLRPTVLVVDPKQELWEVVKGHAGNRKVSMMRYKESGKGPLLL
jgi:hypothetical protein